MRIALTNPVACTGGSASWVELAKQMIIAAHRSSINWRAPASTTSSASWVGPFTDLGEDPKFKAVREFGR